MQVVRRVGKDQVERGGWSPQDGEGIRSYSPEIINPDLSSCLFYKINTLRILVNGRNKRASTRNEFKRDASCSGEEIEDGCFFKVDQVGEDVEERLLGKIGRRSYRQV